MQDMLLQQNFKLYQSLRAPAHSAPILFYRVNISGLKIRLVLKKSQNISLSKEREKLISRQYTIIGVKNCTR